jgi:hypothetical protein
MFLEDIILVYMINLKQTKKEKKKICTEQKWFL